MQKLIRFSSFILAFNFFIGSSVFSMENIDTNDCVNSTNPECYPFHYPNNPFCTVVAWENYVAPAINICLLKLNHYFWHKWNNESEIAIVDELAALADAEPKIRLLLSEVIKKFDNGLSSEDFATIRGLVESLNQYKCKTCIEQFVEIVSKHSVDFDGYGGISSLLNNDIEVIDSNGLTKAEIKKQFYDFNMNFYQSAALQGQCIDHDFEELRAAACSKKSTVSRTKTALCNVWTHPLHWSSLLYGTVSMVAPVFLPLTLSKNNRAGSYIGDMANWSNTLVIPTYILFNLFQNYMSKDRLKAKKLLDEIERRLANSQGIFEIAAKVIGKMENNITESEARGFLKALVLLGWPKDKVNEFVELAATFNPSAKNKNQLVDFAKSLMSDYDKQGKPYSDQDIVDAFNLGSENGSHIVDMRSSFDELDEEN